MHNTQNRLSLYLHFPFCRKKCGYCDFPSTDQGLYRIDKYTEALIKELSLRAKSAHDKSIFTLYIGGGSPNLIGWDNFQRLYKALHKNYNLNSLQEFTVEINPGSDENLLALFARCKVTRLSLGCQSFQPSELNRLGRIHQVESIQQTLECLQNHHFPHLNLDLIYGIPGQSLNTWQKTLSKAVQTRADHLSLYNLIYEPRTPLTHLINSGKIHPLSEDLEWQLYDFSHQYLKEQGFDHYEISNWSKPGSHSLHNMVYWSGDEYLGFGAGAHSFNGQIRCWNQKNIADYIESLQKNNLPSSGSEKINANAKIYEYLLLGLRTSRGLDSNEFSRLSVLDFAEVYEQFVHEFGTSFENKYGFFTQDRLRLTPAGWFISDYVIQNLMSAIDNIRGQNGY